VRLRICRTFVNYSQNIHTIIRFDLIHFLYVITLYAVTGRAKKFHGSISCPLIELPPRWSANSAVATAKPLSAGEDLWS
jgi:hypothetical protein